MPILTEAEIERKFSERLRVYRAEIRKQLIYEEFEGEILQMAEKIAVEHSVRYEEKIRELMIEISELQFELSNSGSRGEFVGYSMLE